MTVTPLEPPGWLAGGRTEGSAEGAPSLPLGFVFDELASAGAIGIGMGGATDLRGPAMFKSYCGARLVASHAVRTYSLRMAARPPVDRLASRHKAHP